MPAIVCTTDSAWDSSICLLIASVYLPDNFMGTRRHSINSIANILIYCCMYFSQQKTKSTWVFVSLFAIGPSLPSTTSRELYTSQVR